MRINAYIAASTALSRRAADIAVAAGRVMINGHVASLGDSVEPSGTVTLDGHAVTPRATHTYIVLNKPIGYVSSRRQQGASPTVYKLLPAEFKLLRIAGRLDEASSGLLLLTDDGAAIQRYTHPSGGKTKIYELKLNKPFTDASITRLESGVILPDGPSKPHLIQVQGTSLSVELTEGRNRQLRRTFGALGYEVVALARTTLGPFTLGNLATGSWRHATAKELS